GPVQGLCDRNRAGLSAVCERQWGRHDDAPFCVNVVSVSADSAFLRVPRRFIRNSPICSTISAQAWVCQPQMIHSTLLAMKQTKPARRFSRWRDPTSQAATRVTTMAGHCSRLIRVSVSMQTQTRLALSRSVHDQASETKKPDRKPAGLGVLRLFIVPAWPSARGGGDAGPAR